MIVWRKSSHSGTQSESECVEVARLPDRTGPAIGVRDSKNPAGPILTLAPADFHTLVTRLKSDAPSAEPHSPSKTTINLA